MIIAHGAQKRRGLRGGVMNDGSFGPPSPGEFFFWLGFAASVIVVLWFALEVLA